MGGFYIQYLEGMFVSRTIPFTSGVIVLLEMPCTYPVQGFFGHHYTTTSQYSSTPHSSSPKLQSARADVRIECGERCG